MSLNDASAAPNAPEESAAVLHFDGDQDTVLRRRLETLRRFNELLAADTGLHTTTDDADLADRYRFYLECARNDVLLNETGCDRAAD